MKKVNFYDILNITIGDLSEKLERKEERNEKIHEGCLNGNGWFIYVGSNDKRKSS